MGNGHREFPGTPSSTSDLRGYMLDPPDIGDSVVPEMLLKVLEPYRREGVVLILSNAVRMVFMISFPCLIFN